MTPEQQVDALIRGPQYAMRQADKDAILIPLLRSVCREVAEHCRPYSRFLERSGGDCSLWRTMADIPPLPVAMFKRFLLSAVPPEKVVRELLSSSTTEQRPSRILIDKTTAFRQSRALTSILKEHIGGRRRPLLVLDVPEAVEDRGGLSARGAAIRGIATFASKTVFGMKSPGTGTSVAGGMQADWDGIAQFFEAYRDGPVLLFGFTFMVWASFVLEAERLGLQFHVSKAILLHSGGWKKLSAQAVSKDEFGQRASRVLGCGQSQVLDFYGMVEQVGTVFVDCEAGHKHAPAFGDVLLRQPGTLAAVAPGETGIIEVVSVLPTSYPGQALITEDQGLLVGVDDCPCGRKGRYFRFTRRIEQAEVRGCGDTYAQSRANSPLGEENR